MKDFLKKINLHALIPSVILAALVGFVGWYFFLPAINLRSMGFWVYLTFILLAGAVPFININWYAIKRALKNSKLPPSKRQKRVQSEEQRSNKSSFIALGVAFLPLVVALLGLLISSPLFFARSYADIIDIENAVFEEDMPEASEITNIALMDTASAQILGDRTLGSLSHVVSQYKVSDTYTQINYKGSPKKVANLEYDNIFKWIVNSADGIPGMVMVDPVKSDAEYIELSKPIKYARSAFFGQDLMRKLRFEYPTKIFSSVMFEVDDEGNPYYIVSCVKPQVFWFGAKDVTEVIIFDPTDGTSTIHPVGEVPSWIDIVYDGDLACKKYDWRGTLSRGFFNSIIGNVDCNRTTDDYGYIALGDDVWYFTGVTSVTADNSNIGFVLTNARTGEYKFYPVIGAEEHSAMAAAEGEVQEKGYVASFPSLVNVSGHATYIMVLKDDAGLVKLFALVKVQNYSIVATGTTQAEAMSAYKKLLQQSGENISTATKSAEITVENVRMLTVANVATVYITSTDGEVYKGYLEADEELVLVRIGDRLKISYVEGEGKIHVIDNWELIE